MPRTRSSPSELRRSASNFAPIPLYREQVGPYESSYAKPCRRMRRVGSVAAARSLMTVVSGSLGLRQSNRLRVIETLYSRPGTSRAELARTTGLSRATVSMLVEELQQAHIVEENGVV